MGSSLPFPPLPLAYFCAHEFGLLLPGAAGTQALQLPAAGLRQAATPAVSNCPPAGRQLRARRQGGGRTAHSSVQGRPCTAALQPAEREAVAYQRRVCACLLAPAAADEGEEPAAAASDGEEDEAVELAPKHKKDKKKKKSAGFDAAAGFAGARVYVCFGWQARARGRSVAGGRVAGAGRQARVEGQAGVGYSSGAAVPAPARLAADTY